MDVSCKEDTLDFLEKIIALVEDNNEINNASWGDWIDGDHICQVYGEERNIIGCKILNKIIECNNDNDIAYDYLKELEFLAYGYNFSDNSDRHRAWFERKISRHTQIDCDKYYSHG